MVTTSLTKIKLNPDVNPYQVIQNILKHQKKMNLKRVIQLDLDETLFPFLTKLFFSKFLENEVNRIREQPNHEEQLKKVTQIFDDEFKTFNKKPLAELSENIDNFQSLDDLRGPILLLVEKQLKDLNSKIPKENKLPDAKEDLEQVYDTVDEYVQEILAQDDLIKVESKDEVCAVVTENQVYKKTIFNDSKFFFCSNV